MRAGTRRFSLMQGWATGDVHVRVEDLDSMVALPWWKRCFDVSGATLAIILLTPLALVIAAAIKCTSRGPVLFRQRRAGLNGQPFAILKFRTMELGAESTKHALLHMNDRSDPVFKMQDDPRVTPVGRMLRRMSLDEIPQFINVLRGQMSLVGPRPLPEDESELLEPWQRQRLRVTPGVTGIWQVSGRSEVNLEEWIRMDLTYVHHRSLGLDLRILLRTIPAVLRGVGAH